MADEKKKIKACEITPYLSCMLCGGYFVDATTITECLHSFCRSCIVRYFESSNYCPICDVLVHKSNPFLSIKSDKTLQTIVYKFFPKSHADEKRRRRLFYFQEIKKRKKGDHFKVRRKVIPEFISLALEPLSEGANIFTQVRYFKCPSILKLSQLKRLLRAKFDLPQLHPILFSIVDGSDLDTLRNDVSLADVALLTNLKQDLILTIYYKIYLSKKVKFDPKFENELLEIEFPDSKSESSSFNGIASEHGGGIFCNEKSKPISTDQGELVSEGKIKTEIVSQNALKCDSEIALTVSNNEDAFKSTCKNATVALANESKMNGQNLAILPDVKPYNQLSFVGGGIVNTLPIILPSQPNYGIGLLTPNNIVGSNVLGSFIQNVSNSFLDLSNIGGNILPYSLSYNPYMEGGQNLFLTSPIVNTNDIAQNNSFIISGNDVNNSYNSTQNITVDTVVNKSLNIIVNNSVISKKCSPKSSKKSVKKKLELQTVKEQPKLSKTRPKIRKIRPKTEEVHEKEIQLAISESGEIRVNPGKEDFETLSNVMTSINSEADQLLKEIEAGNTINSSPTSGHNLQDTLVNEFYVENGSTNFLDNDTQNVRSLNDSTSTIYSTENAPTVLVSEPCFEDSGDGFDGSAKLNQIKEEISNILSSLSHDNHVTVITRNSNPSTLLQGGVEEKNLAEETISISEGAVKKDRRKENTSRVKKGRDKKCSVSQKTKVKKEINKKKEISKGESRSNLDSQKSCSSVNKSRMKVDNDTRNILENDSTQINESKLQGSNNKCEQSSLNISSEKLCTIVENKSSCKVYQKDRINLKNTTRQSKLSSSNFERCFFKDSISTQIPKVTREAENRTSIARGSPKVLGDIKNVSNLLEELQVLGLSQCAEVEFCCDNLTVESNNNNLKRKESDDFDVGLNSSFESVLRQKEISDRKYLKVHKKVEYVENSAGAKNFGENDIKVVGEKLICVDSITKNSLDFEGKNFKIKSEDSEKEFGASSKYKYKTLKVPPKSWNPSVSRKEIQQKFSRGISSTAKVNKFFKTRQKTVENKKSSSVPESGISQNSKLIECISPKDELSSKKCNTKESKVDLENVPNRIQTRRSSKEVQWKKLSKDLITTKKTIKDSTNIKKISKSLTTVEKTNLKPMINKPKVAKVPAQKCKNNKSVKILKPKTKNCQTSQQKTLEKIKEEPFSNKYSDSSKFELMDPTLVLKNICESLQMASKCKEENNQAVTSTKEFNDKLKGPDSPLPLLYFHSKSAKTSNLRAFRKNSNAESNSISEGLDKKTRSESIDSDNIVSGYTKSSDECYSPEGSLRNNEKFLNKIEPNVSDLESDNSKKILQTSSCNKIDLKTKICNVKEAIVEANLTENKLDSKKDCEKSNSTSTNKSLNSLSKIIERITKNSPKKATVIGEVSDDKTHKNKFKLNSSEKSSLSPEKPVVKPKNISENVLSIRNSSFDLSSPGKAAKLKKISTPIKEKVASTSMNSSTAFSLTSPTSILPPRKYNLAALPPRFYSILPPRSYNFAATNYLSAASVHPETVYTSADEKDKRKESPLSSTQDIAYTLPNKVENKKSSDRVTVTSFSPMDKRPSVEVKTPSPSSVKNVINLSLKTNPVEKARNHESTLKLNEPVKCVGKLNSPNKSLISSVSNSVPSSANKELNILSPPTKIASKNSTSSTSSSLKTSQFSSDSQKVDAKVSVKAVSPIRTSHLSFHSHKTNAEVSFAAVSPVKSFNSQKANKEVSVTTVSPIRTFHLNSNSEKVNAEVSIATNSSIKTHLSSEGKVTAVSTPKAPKLNTEGSVAHNFSNLETSLQASASMYEFYQSNYLQNYSSLLNNFTQFSSNFNALGNNSGCSIENTGNVLKPNNTSPSMSANNATVSANAERASKKTDVIGKILPETFRNGTSSSEIRETANVKVSPNCSKKSISNTYSPAKSLTRTSTSLDVTMCSKSSEELKKDNVNFSSMSTSSSGSNKVLSKPVVTTSCNNTISASSLSIDNLNSLSSINDPSKLIQNLFAYSGLTDVHKLSDKTADVDLDKLLFQTLSSENKNSKVNETLANDHSCKTKESTTPGKLLENKMPVANNGSLNVTPSKIPHSLAAVSTASISPASLSTSFSTVSSVKLSQPISKGVYTTASDPYVSSVPATSYNYNSNALNAYQLAYQNQYFKQNETMNYSHDKTSEMQNASQSLFGSYNTPTAGLNRARSSYQGVHHKEDLSKVNTPITNFNSTLQHASGKKKSDQAQLSSLQHIPMRNSYSEYPGYNSSLDMNRFNPLLKNSSGSYNSQAATQNTNNSLSSSTNNIEQNSTKIALSATSSSSKTTVESSQPAYNNFTAAQLSSFKNSQEYPGYCSDTSKKNIDDFSSSSFYSSNYNNYANFFSNAQSYPSTSLGSFMPGSGYNFPMPKFSNNPQYLNASGYSFPSNSYNSNHSYVNSASSANPASTATTFSTPLGNISLPYYSNCSFSYNSYPYLYQGGDMSLLSPSAHSFMPPFPCLPPGTGFNARNSSSQGMNEIPSGFFPMMPFMSPLQSKTNSSYFDPGSYPQGLDRTGYNSQKADSLKFSKATKNYGNRNKSKKSRGDESQKSVGQSKPIK